MVVTVMTKAKTTKKTTATKSKKAIKENTTPTVPQVFDNPLLQQQTTELTITPSQEVEKKVEIISEIESLATITKQHLAIKREQVTLEIDNKRLETAKQTIGAIDKIINSVLQEDVIERVAQKINTPQDMKFMAEAADRLTGTLKNLMPNNPLDEFGNKKKTKINFMFKTSGATQGIIQVDSGDD